MAKLSAGILVFRRPTSDVEVFLVHPGGPFWEKKDVGAWSLPKGEYTQGEDPFSVAKREFEEETSLKIDGNFIALGDIRQPSGKVITAWAVEGEADPTRVKSNLFTMEWPPKSEQTQSFPEVDRAGWFVLSDARAKILKGQVGFLDRLQEKLEIPRTQELVVTRADGGGDDAPKQGSLF